MSSSDIDPALETLLLPFRQELLSWPPEAVLFLRARTGASLRPAEFPGLVCEQTFKPDADALAAGGFTLDNNDQRKYPLVMVLPPRQRDECRALLARAVATTAPGGRVLIAQANNEGARTTLDDLERLAGPLATLIKHRCRAAWTAPLEDAADASLMKEWLALDAPRRIDERFVSRPGVFAWDRIDVASALLASHLPDNLRGTAADLGAGFGYLSVELLNRCRGIRSLDLFEAEARSLDLARENLAGFTDVEIGYHWHDVTMGLPRKYDAIVTNPPFHTSTHGDRPDIGKRFIAIAAQSLNPRGRLWLVANRHLPYEQVLNASFGKVRVVAQESGFKIIEATRT